MPALLIPLNDASWLDALQPIMFAKPPHNHASSHEKDDAEEYYETPDKRALAFLTLTFKP